MNSFLSDSMKKGSVGDFISQVSVLPPTTDDLLMNGALRTTQLSHLMSIAVHIDSQPNEFWAATNLDACAPTLNESVATCEEWIEIIRAPLILFECYFQESDSGPKIRQIPYAITNNDNVAPTGFVTLRRVNESNDTIAQGMIQESIELSKSPILSFLAICALGTFIIVVIVRMWPSSRRGYEIVP